MDVIFEAAGIAFSPNEQDIPLRRVSIYLCSIHSWNVTECEQSSPGELILSYMYSVRRRRHVRTPSERPCIVSPEAPCLLHIMSPPVCGKTSEVVPHLLFKTSHSCPVPLHDIPSATRSFDGIGSAREVLGHQRNKAALPLVIVSQRRLTPQAG